jgi:hypothetical protein
MGEPFPALVSGEACLVDLRRAAARSRDRLSAALAEQLRTTLDRARLRIPNRLRAAIDTGQPLLLLAAHLEDCAAPIAADPVDGHLRICVKRAAWSDLEEATLVAATVVIEDRRAAAPEVLRARRSGVSDVLAPGDVGWLHGGHTDPFRRRVRAVFAGAASKISSCGSGSVPDPARAVATRRPSGLA